MPAGVYTENKINETALKTLFQLFKVEVNPNGPETAEQRLRRIINEVNGGQRTFSDVVRSLMRASPDAEAGIAQMFETRGLDADPQRVARITQDVLSGGRTFTDLQGSLDRLDELQGDITDPPSKKGPSKVPQGARVVKVVNPEGSDAAALYYLVYEWNGTEITFEVGDSDKFIKLFGGTAEDRFASVETVNQRQFDNAGYIDSGGVDSILGSDESLASQFEREARALGLEDIPGWIKNDPEAVQLLITAATEGWSSGRTWKELSKTKGFDYRFGEALDRFLQPGVGLEQAIGNFMAEEAQIRGALTANRPNQQFKVGYINNLMTNGWTAAEVDQVLKAGKQIRRNPELLSQVNTALVYQGFDPLDEVGLLNLLASEEGTPEDIKLALNRASAGTALAQAGVSGVDPELLASVVDDFSNLHTVDDYAALSQQLALTLIQNERDLDLKKFGLKRDDLIAAAFGDESPSGKDSAEVLNMLARLQRDRQAAAGGIGGTSGFINDQGRLIVRGM